MTNRIFIITGIMAAGKSTVAELLAKRFAHGVHVRGDVFRRMVVSGRMEMGVEESEEANEQLLLRYRLAAKTAEEYYRAGFTVVVQDNYLGAMAFDFLRMFTEKNLYYITLCPKPSVVYEREENRHKKGYGEWTVEMLDTGMRQDNPKIGLWLDSSDLTADETVDAILQQIDKAKIFVKDKL